MSFADVALCTYDSSSSLSRTLVPLLATKLRNVDRRFQFKLQTAGENPEKYTLFRNDTGAKKSGDSWNAVLVSDRPMTRDEEYFEIEIEHNVQDSNFGVYIGVSDGINHSGFYGHCLPSTCAVYNSPECKMAGAPRDNIIKKRNIKNEKWKVVGVVVSKISDDIKFYLNGTLLAIGTLKPSMMSNIHVFTSSYYNGSIMSIGNKYKRIELIEID